MSTTPTPPAESVRAGPAREEEQELRTRVQAHLDHLDAEAAKWAHQVNSLKRGYGNSEIEIGLRTFRRKWDEALQLASDLRAALSPAPAATGLTLEERVERACRIFVNNADSFFDEVWPEGPNDDGHRGADGYVRLLSEREQDEVRSAMRAVVRECDRTRGPDPTTPTPPAESVREATQPTGPGPLYPRDVTEIITGYRNIGSEGDTRAALDHTLNLLARLNEERTHPSGLSYLRPDVDKLRGQLLTLAIGVEEAQQDDPSRDAIDIGDVDHELLTDAANMLETLFRIADHG